jgi:hypothetical protein
MGRLDELSWSTRTLEVDTKVASEPDLSPTAAIIDSSK